MKLRRIIVWTVFVLFILYFGPKFLGGFSYNEETAIQHSFPNQNGTIVFEKAFDNKKVIILDTGRKQHVKQVDKIAGIFYRVRNTTDIQPIESEEAMSTTWTAQLVDDQYYDTIFGVKVSDSNIKTVIVSNEGIEKSLTNIEEIKTQATVFVEMKIIKGYAAHYSQLKASETGNFVFRGLNAKGEIIFVK